MYCKEKKKEFFNIYLHNQLSWAGEPLNDKIYLNENNKILVNGFPIEYYLIPELENTKIGIACNSFVEKLIVNYVIDWERNTEVINSISDNTISNCYIVETFDSLEKGIGISYCWKSEVGIKLDAYQDRFYPLSKEETFDFYEDNAKMVFYEDQNSMSILRALELHKEWWCNREVETIYLANETRLNELPLNKRILIEYGKLIRG